MLASTNDHMLAAISRRIDLDDRLDDIIGKPRRVQYLTATASVAMASAYALLDAYKKRQQDAAEAGQGDLRSQILKLIDQIDYMSAPVKGHFMLDSSVAQPLVSASDELRYLEQGLDARELSRKQADGSLRAVDYFLTKAVTVQSAIERQQSFAMVSLHCKMDYCRNSYRRWRIYSAALITLAVIMRIAVPAMLAPFKITTTEGVMLSLWWTPSAALAAAAWTVWANKLNKKSRARMHGWESIGGMSDYIHDLVRRQPRKMWAYTGAAQARHIADVHTRYMLIRKRVRRLFDEAGDRSPEFAPRI